jgi:hypothetical protein
MDDPYRSFVVRVRRRPNAPGSLRIEIEDLLGGRRNTVTGPRAEQLNDDLNAAVDADVGPPAPPARAGDAGLD